MFICNLKIIGMSCHNTGPVFAGLIVISIIVENRQQKLKSSAFIQIESTDTEEGKKLLII